MDSEAVADRIVEHFERLAPQVQAAARFVLDHPQDVAMLSMREQARRAGVPPVTMIRLARQLGFPAYAEFRGIFAAALRRPGWRFSDRAGALQERQKRGGEEALLQQIGQALSQQVAELPGHNAPADWIDAARALDAAGTVYCLGLRSCFPVAFHFHYVYGLFRANGVLIDGAGDTAMDRLRHAGPKDALLAVSVAPYTAASVEMAQFAVGRRARVVAITDSRVAPLAALADHALIVPTATPSFFHAITPAFAAAEILAALIAARAGRKGLEALRHAEAQLAAFNTYWPPSGKRMGRKAPAARKAFS